VTNGLFFRAESFFDFARHLDALSSGRYAERNLHELSHGESFLRLFENRLGTRSNAIYLLDEPEAALSPARQLAFLRLLHRWHLSGRVQAIIATHSPILMAYPHATILSFEDSAVRETGYRETEHYRLTSAFLAAPERTLRHLLADDDGEEEATP
jgi:predicted ATPase